jgi:peroxin-14
MPHLKPPSEDAFESTTSQLTAQFDEAATLLKQIQEDTVNARDAVQQQQQAVESAVEQVKNVVSELRIGEEKSQNEIREIRSEVDIIRDMLPKVCWDILSRPSFQTTALTLE